MRRLSRHCVGGIWKSACGRRVSTPAHTMLKVIKGKLAVISQHIFSKVIFVILRLLRLGPPNQQLPFYHVSFITCHYAASTSGLNLREWNQIQTISNEVRLQCDLVISYFSRQTKLDTQIPLKYFNHLWDQEIDRRCGISSNMDCICFTECRESLEWMQSCGFLLVKLPPSPHLGSWALTKIMKLLI